MIDSRFKLQFAALLFSIFLISSMAFAQQQQDYGLLLKNGTLKIDENGQEFFRNFNVSESEIYNNRFYRIIQFYSIPDASTRKKLEDIGIQLLDYIPNLAYFASIDVKFNAGADVLSKIRSVNETNQMLKLAPMLYEESYPEYALLDSDKIRLMVSYFSDIEPDEALKAFAEQGFLITGSDNFAHYVLITAGLDEIDAIASIPFVYYVEPIYPEPEPENYTGRTLHRSNALASDFSTGRHYDGSGVSVMLQDDGTIGPHIDYQGRIIQQYLSYNSGDHGDHCAGIIMAAGNLNPKGRGNAFGANLYVYGAAPEYPGFTSIPSHYFSNDIRVTSTSYSNGCNAGYTSLARTMDQQIRVYPALMHVFSAGNEGTSDCGYGAGAGWGNVTGGHKIGKNVLTVANLDYKDELAGSSSRGPAHDGRIKPDIAAKGTDVFSTIDPNSYGLKSGTSMSCPGVAGTMTQLFHAYRELNEGRDPLGGLIKAIALNTADDLGNSGPDFKFGYGRINGLKAVEVLEQGRYDSATITNGEIVYHEIFVPENTAQMKVMVYWTDYEAAQNAAVALVNNLDIVLTDPQNTSWLPWVLNAYPHPDSLNKVAVRGVDSRNNMEQVTLENPTGNYTLEVTGTLIPQGPQKYYVVYEFIPDEIVVTYPMGGETLVPGESELIRWDAYGNQGSFTLEYSVDNGQSWSLITESLSGDQRFYSWTLPTAITSQGLVKVTREDKSGVSPANFSMMNIPANLSIDWVCDNALHLSWNEVLGATSYTIYKLGEKYMEPIGTTTVNSLIVSDINVAETEWFSISATGPNGEQSRRSLAIEKSPGLLNCFPVDLMMVSVPSVNWGIFQACMNVEDLEVTITAKNFGLESISNPSFSYQLNDGEIFTATFNGDILPDSTIAFTFPDPINISEVGNYLLKTWLDYTPDQNPENNQLETNIEVIEGTLFTPGNIQTMENYALCIPAPICELYSCALDDTWLNLTNNVLDDIDWRTWSGTTYSYGTGPSFDHTTGTTAGKYLYLEASVTCFFRQAILTTPCIDLTGGVSPSLSLWYHAFGSDIGSLHVDVFDGNQIVYDVAEPVAGNMGDAWHEMTADLSPWNGQVIGIRIRGYTGGGEKGDLAIDDISIMDVTNVSAWDNPAVSQITVFPNPATGIFTLNLVNAGMMNYELKVMDIFGKIVHKQTITPANGFINEVVDISDKSGGLYFVELTSDKNSYQTKISIR
mgnify:FL=1